MSKAYQFVGWTPNPAGFTMKYSISIPLHQENSITAAAFTSAYGFGHGHRFDSLCIAYEGEASVTIVPMEAGHTITGHLVGTTFIAYMAALGYPQINSIPADFKTRPPAHLLDVEPLYELLHEVFISQKVRIYFGGVLVVE